MRKPIQWAGLIAAVVVSLFVTTGTAQAVAMPPGFNEIKARHTEKCLDVADAGQESGRQVIQSSCRGGNNQHWRFVDQGDDWAAIVVQHTGKCLDVAGGSLDQGTIVIQADCHFRGNQLWKMDDKENPFFRLIAQHSRMCLDIAGADRGDGASAIQAECHEDPNQQFSIG